MENNEIKQPVESHKTKGKKAKTALIIACALFAVGTITFGTLYTYNMINGKKDSGSTEELEKKIVELNIQIEEKNTKIKELEKSGVEFQKQIDTLKKEVQDLTTKLKEAEDKLKVEENKVIVTFINKDSTFNSSAKIVAGKTLAESEKTLPTVSTNYQWQDASGTEFTINTAISSSCIIKENCLYSITLDSYSTKAVTGSSSVKITATFSNNIAAEDISWSGDDGTYIKSLSISDDKTVCTLTIGDTADNNHHAITCTHTPSGVSASCNVFVYNKQVTLQADVSLSTYLSNNDVTFNSLVATSLTYQNRLITMRYRRSTSTSIQLSVFLKSGTYSTSLAFTFLYTGSSTSDYGYTTATMPADFWAKLEDGAAVTLSGS